MQHSPIHNATKATFTDPRDGKEGMPQRVAFALPGGYGFPNGVFDEKFSTLMPSSRKSGKGKKKDE